MFKKIITLLGFLTSLNSFAAGIDNIQKLNWDGLEVVYMEDERFPTYDVVVYFADGALSDSKRRYGETNAMFGLIDSGTNRYTQSQISDNLEFYGVSYAGNVTHEFSTFSVSGLVKDVIPTFKKICHLFTQTNYPKEEVQKEKRRFQSSMNNLINSHGELASRAFREINLKGTPYSSPVSGKLSTVKNIHTSHLIAKRQYFNEKVYKRVYITGPKNVLSIKNTLTDNCGWKNSASLFKRSTSSKKNSKSGPTVHLITVPKANQAQVRIGKFLEDKEIGNPELMSLTSGFLGGGFTSLLFREVRVKRGLTYSLSAYAGRQAQYGRSIISTFTKNETIIDLLNALKETLGKVEAGSFNDADLERMRNYLMGSHLFSFEKSSSLLRELMFLDHVGRPYDSLVKYPEIVKSFSKEEVISATKSLFGWNGFDIVVLGPKSLRSELSKIGKVKVINYKNFL